MKTTVCPRPARHGRAHVCRCRWRRIVAKAQSPTARVRIDVVRNERQVPESVVFEATADQRCDARADDVDRDAARRAVGDEAARSRIERRRSRANARRLRRASSERVRPAARASRATKLRRVELVFDCPPGRVAGGVLHEHVERVAIGDRPVKVDEDDGPRVGPGHARWLLLAARLLCRRRFASGVLRPLLARPSSSPLHSALRPALWRSGRFGTAVLGLGSA